MRDRNRGTSVVHRDLPLDRHIADGPPPPGHAMFEREALEVDVARRINSSRRPLVYTEPDPAVSDDDAGVEGSQPQHPPAGGECGDDEQAVIAPGPQPADRSHRVTAEPIRDEPF